MSILQSLLSTTSASSRRLETLDLRHCVIPLPSLTEAVKYYVMQGLCAHLLCEPVSDGFEWEPIVEALPLCEDAKLETISRVQTFLEDNPSLKTSLTACFLETVDSFLDKFTAQQEPLGKDQKFSQRPDKTHLKTYFTELWTSLPK